MRQFKNVEIILEESKAVLANSFYIIPIGNGKARGIVTDANANKVEIGDVLPENIGLTDFGGSGGESAEGNVYRKDQIDLMVNLINERLDQGGMGNIEFTVDEDMNLIQTYVGQVPDFELVDGELILNN